MPNVRNTFTHQIESRTASTAKDSRCVNGYFEQRDQRTKEFIKRPGLVQLATTPTTGTAQGMFRFAGKLYGVTNNSLWSMTTGNVTSTIGSIIGTVARCSFTQTANDTYLVFHNGTNGYTYNGTTLAQITSAGFPTNLVPGIVFLDQTVYVMTTSGRIYNSAVGDPTTWGALDFISAEAEPDNAVGLSKHLNYILAFGEWSTEFFYDAANATGSPLARADSYRMEIGCANGNSIVQSDQCVFWIGKSKTHGLGAYVLDGVSPNKISTPFIERYLNANATSAMSAYSLRVAGHLWYVLNLVDANLTFVFDLDSQSWYQWTTYDGSAEQLFAGRYYAEFNNLCVMQNASNGKLYSFSPTVYTDDGQHIYYRSITDRSDSGTIHRKFYRNMTIIGDTVSATLYVRHSDDDYNTFSNWRSIDLSVPRPQLNVLGQARRRSWEFLCTDDVPLRLEAAEVSFDLGRLETGPQRG